MPREAGLSADGRESGHRYVLRVGPSSRVAQLVATGPGAGTTPAGNPRRSTDAVPRALVLHADQDGPGCGHVAHRRRCNNFAPGAVLNGLAVMTVTTVSRSVGARRRGAVESPHEAPDSRAPTGLAVRRRAHGVDRRRQLLQAAYAVEGWGIRPNCISSETWS